MIEKYLFWILSKSLALILTISFIGIDLFAQSGMEIPFIKNDDVIVHRFAYTYAYVEEAEQSKLI